jgi:hypothetical protein
MASDRKPRARETRSTVALSSATTLGAASAVALTAGGARPVEAQQTGSERTRARYQVTEHVETSTARTATIAGRNDDARQAQNP